MKYRIAQKFEYATLQHSGRKKALLNRESLCCRFHAIFLSPNFRNNHFYLPHFYSKDDKFLGLKFKLFF